MHAASSHFRERPNRASANVQSGHDAPSAIYDRPDLACLSAVVRIIACVHPVGLALDLTANFLEERRTESLRKDT
jgi:hypothetical protein